MTLQLKTGESPNVDTCHEHSGCITAIDNLEKSDKDQWETIGKMRDRVDSVIMRLNVILGTLLVGIIIGFIDLIIKK